MTRRVDQPCWSSIDNIRNPDMTGSAQRQQLDLVQAMNRDFSWERSVKALHEGYMQVLGVPVPARPVSTLKRRSNRMFSASTFSARALFSTAGASAVPLPAPTTASIATPATIENIRPRCSRRRTIPST